MQTIIFIQIWTLKLALKKGYHSREGVIIEGPLKWQFHNLVTVILTSWTAVIGVVENFDNVVNVI